MIFLWLALLLVRQGCTLVPVITVQLGEPVTLTCALENEWFGIKSLHWYKQSAGDTLKVITMLRKNTDPKYGPGVSASRLKTTYYEKITSLTILRTTKEDEGIYHCAILDWTENTWRGTYLSIKGNDDKAMNYTIVQRSQPANTARLGDSATLECSVLSHSKNRSCLGGLSVFWFRARSHKSHPEVIFTDGINQDDCTLKHDRKCIYSFFHNVSSSEFGTYYCAIATCGEILFGNGTTFEAEKLSDSAFIILVTVVICLISVVLHITIICHQTHKKSKRHIKDTSSRHDDLGQQEDNNDDVENDVNYAALHFSGGKGKKKPMDESVYSQVKY
ncbi:titin-like [Xiphophorus couchianus]|uniref:titin-like n=1 Tax=Xiphophorus couchianus TaxID=32473 RepID=UPI001016AE9D|nr:titin-like [Xiphophorus couchianus]